MEATTPGRSPDSLLQARRRLDRRLEDIARRYAGQPQPEVLGALEREVAAAAVMPSRPDLSTLARRISEAPGSG